MNKIEFKAEMSSLRKTLRHASRSEFGEALKIEVQGVSLRKFIAPMESRPVSIKVMFALESAGILPPDFDNNRKIRYN